MLRHRMRNISAGLRGSLTLIEEEVTDSMPSGLAEYFPLMYRECDALQTLANRLTLFFDQLPEVELCSAEEISKKALEDVAARFPSATLRLEGDCDGRVDNVMENSLTELLVNACEAAPSGVIETRLATQGDKVRWIVLDSGTGFDHAGIDFDCFAPFTTSRPRHLGLGLPVARRLCEYAGGECKLYSTENDESFSAGVEISALRR